MLTTQCPHLVLLPGLVNDSRLWQHQASGLADIAHVSVGDLTKGHTIAEMASDILASAPAQQFVLAGLSMGGYVALEIMRQAPERVLALALLDTSARPDTPTSLEKRSAVIEQAESNYQAVIEELMPKQLHAVHMDDAELVSMITDMAMSLGNKTFIRQQRAIAGRIDSIPSLSLITCPTLVLCGRDDAITPIGLHQEMVTEIEGAGLVIEDNCGHLSALEQPTRINEALTQWLTKINC
ncbi:MAG: alpha/beta fold hydrolase [Pseudomonadota bacterium]|nr:alpha/beta fold hydrolase [Pseudomonadota bacterium]